MASSLRINTKKLKEVYQSTVDFMMESDFFSSVVKLYYPPRRVRCTNVIGNINHFGCLECGGSGYKMSETTEEIRLRIHYGIGGKFDKNTFKKFGLNIDAVDGDLFTLGYLSDAPKMSSCNYIEIFSDLNHSRFRYQLSSEVMPYGFCKDKYVFAFWTRKDLGG